MNDQDRAPADPDPDDDGTMSDPESPAIASELEGSGTGLAIPHPTPGGRRPPRTAEPAGQRHAPPAAAGRAAAGPSSSGDTLPSARRPAGPPVADVTGSSRSRSRQRPAGPAADPFANPPWRAQQSQPGYRPLRLDKGRERSASPGGTSQASTSQASTGPASTGPASTVTGMPGPAGWSPDETIKIGLWGSPSSGKTTFLAALSLSAGRKGSPAGHWVVIPENDISRDLMIDLRRRLVKDHQFPDATHPGTVQPLSWIFRGTVPSAGAVPRWRRRRSVRRSFRLDLIDVSGEAFGDSPGTKEGPAPPDVVAAALDHLANAQGLIYLFDPLAEREQGNSAEYVNRTMAELSMRMLDQMSGQYLPKQLSICVTKFDDPRFYGQAMRRKLVNEAPDGSLRVLDDDARKLFEMYCDGRFWDDVDNPFQEARFVRDMLQQHFDPDSTRYFVTSSIGLRHWPDGIRGDMNNLRPAPGGLTIRGPIEPINVIEPLISLHQRITGGVGVHG